MPSNHVVYLITVLPFIPQVIEFLKNYPDRFDPEKQILKSPYTWGVVEKNGEHYMLCSEGVGNSAPLERERADVQWFAEQKDGSAFNVLPCVTSHITYKDLIDYKCFTGESLPLDKFIRVFGDRLETNYRIWERNLSA
jgi:hypothetical protein